ncbi:hypothetical protein N7454_011170 [Penicillium verhagenii]|nr:hypothetical protein N7454_011170 [Penicillium verhagenii]
MASEQRNVYCTLLLSDNYLPGAMVLAHSLRDNGTTAKLVALFTPNTLRSETVNELRTVYDELIPVNSIVNGTPANLWLMDRPDLIATFTKIELWRLTQYERVVYIDCDVIALRAPDELFTLDVNFAAAPDVGWPDCFNSGLMVLHPNMQDYYSLKALAERGISFDGADQGLLNMHFQDWHKLSFTYNCTPSANYQYIPAYKHFQSTISLIHFIGSQKPWNLPRQVVPLESPYNQLLNKWWSVYDRHYHAPFVSYSQQETVLPAAHPTDRPELLQSLPESSSGHQHFHHAEDQSVSYHHEEGHSREDAPALVSLESREAHYVPPQHDHHAVNRDTFTPHIPVLSAVPQYVRGEEQYSTFIPPVHYAPAPVIHEHHVSHEARPEAVEHWHRAPSPEPEVTHFQAPKAEWDASREPPPLNTRPEGISLEQKTYTMSEDTALFQPPPSYPEAPKNMYYQVPESKPEPERVAKIFPWENHAPRPTRVFTEEAAVVPRTPSPETPMLPQQVDPLPIESPQAEPRIFPIQAPYEPSAETYEQYSRLNAWDEDPEIQRYMGSLQQSRRGKTQVISGSVQASSSHSRSTSLSTSNFSSSSTATTTGTSTGHRLSMKLTDFPTEIERPSLPVTPAPIHRVRGVQSDDNDASTLPTAEGFRTRRTGWVSRLMHSLTSSAQRTYYGDLQNPLMQLEELRRRQSEAQEDPDHWFRQFSMPRQPES